MRSQRKPIFRKIAGVNHTLITLLLVAAGIWIASILLTLFTLLPINNRIAALTTAALPAGWRQEHKKWDTLHRWRILMLTVAIVCLIFGILSAH